MSTHRRSISIFLSAAVISNIAAGIPAFADVQSIRRGKAFAQANCSYCHSIDKFTRSPRRAGLHFECFTSSILSIRWKMHSLKGCRQVIRGCRNSDWNPVKSGISSVF